MSKFHINKHGVPAPCKAKPGNCPLGGDESHFKTREAAQAHANKINEAEHSILPGVRDGDNSNNSSEKEFRALTERDKVFRDNFTENAIQTTLGHARAHNESYNIRKRNYENFIEDGGLESITSQFDENDLGDDPHFDVRQNLLYYFPSPDNDRVRDVPHSYINPMNAYNAQDEEESEKRLEDATNAIVDVHEIMQETRSQPLIRRRLAERNEDRVFDRFSEKHTIESDRESGKFFDKNVGKHASKVFSDMASDHKFYRYRDSQYEAEEHYARHGTKITNYNEDAVAQKAAFELAKEFHDNKVINSTLEEDNKQIVNRMRKRLEKMFPIED